MLAHSVVVPEAASPDRYMLFMHGILGTRANWRGIARRFIERRDGWGAILVDLREHGESLGLPGPHTLRAAAMDVAELERSLDLPIAGALGHSFGGKVVLQWLESREARPTEAWIIDASPSSSTVDRDSTATAEVLRTLDRLPRAWASRQAFVSAVTEAGQPEAIAQWLAMNLRRDDHGARTFGPELEAIRALVQDYARTDLWRVVDHPPPHATLHFVIGGQSSVFSRGDRARLETIASREPRVFVHVVAEAGHWVHVDAADTLVALLTSPFASHGPGGT